jgi:hypothetical protein
MEYDNHWVIHPHLYLNAIGLHVWSTDINRFHYRVSNFLLYISSLFKPFREPWRNVKLYALHVHRARAPTV